MRTIESKYIGKRVKRIIIGCSFILIATVVTLAFIPNYSCACAQTEGIEKYDGSMLNHISRWMTR
jgi:hypothetical protein